MDIISLRRCTMRSKLGFGKYPNETIGRIIAAKSYRYLRHVYYTYAWIDFDDEVAKAINLTHRIDKPGVSPEMEAINDAEMDARMVGVAFRDGQHRAAQRRRTERAMRMSEKFANSYSKGQMQAMNQGRMQMK